ncbi:DUF4856 domain-containing protein [Porphyromonas sp.]|uniref:DUF4856 domain-containing protein n=1 Tax=Porphyromonas sp. TaxID=1924944 RepID=UPI0026DAFA7B|nr:DUF4856 domain-containing protein [Porphyromonas sp.]MDO4771274.1 DUF4856 domain-containing protein [Porphyromonas sp.]
MKIQWRYTIALAGLTTLLGACSHHTSGEVVESAYMEPLFPEPRYAFSRQGYSSVDTQECAFISEPLDYFYESGLKGARLGSTADFNNYIEYYRDGEFGVSPRGEIATSEFAQPIRERVQDYMDNLIETSAIIGGKGAEDPVLHRRQEAQKGHTGYVGKHIGDKDIYFVDEKGFVVADIFKFAMMGAIYLDKVVNVHLDEKTLTQPETQSKHEALTMQPGRNYTALEHHWDLAYGYYAFWKPLAQAEGIRVIRDSEDKIFRAFVEGRTVMETFRYEDMLTQAKIIKEELAKVIIVRATHLLVGENTLVNLDERPQYAFRFISQACGLIYATQFLRNAEGKPYFSHDEVEEMLSDLREGDGLWDAKKLLSGSEVKGSLSNIATRLCKPIGITPEDIKK